MDILDEKILVMKSKTKKQLPQDVLARRAGSRFFQMVDKAPYNNNKKGQAFVIKSSSKKP
nr:hypothetical protein [uncultured bacterium]